MDAPWMESILKRHEQDREIEKVCYLKLKPAVPEGENYSSKILRGEMEVILKSGKKIKKSIIIKEKDTGRKSEAIKKSPIFNHEARIYREVLSEMEDLMNEYEDKRDLLWGNLIGYQPNTRLIFEDLSETGYKVLDRKNFVDLNHAQLVLQELGRYHAMGKVLLEQGIISDIDFIPYFAIKCSPLITAIFEGGLKKLSTVMLSNWGEEWKEIGERIGNESRVVAEKMKSLLEHESGFKVPCHGDTWMTNMMFRYNSKNEPSSLKFIDFQACHVSSNLYDVLYFLYTSLKPEVRRENLTSLIKFYWSCLIKELDFYKYTNWRPSLDDVMNEVGQLDYYTFVILTVLHPTMTADSTDALDMGKIMGDKPESAFKTSVLCSDKFKSIGEDLKKYVQKGII